jgi:diguanylate cyclase (GGDEF)-like protein
MKPILRVIGAEGLILAAVLAFAAPLELLLATAPYTFPALLAIGSLLAWRFRRSRALFALLALTLAAIALARFAPEARAQPGASLPLMEFSPALRAVGLLLPLNLAVLAFLGERGVLTRMGTLRVGLILVQGVFVIGLASAEPSWAGSFFGYQFLPERFTALMAIADIVVVCFAAAITLTIIRLALRPDPVTRGLLWALPAAALAFDTAARGEPPTLYLAAAVLMLIISVVESSFAMAYRDGLTGLPARRAFNEEILKLGGRYTIAMVDIDHFKRCNDRHGHDVGDQVLRMVAGRLGSVSGGGKAFRYGGEEFAILFPGKDRAECIPHLERLREAVRDTSFTLREADRPRRKPKKPRTARVPARTITVTVSIGAAERSPRHPEPEEVIKAADRALYRAKKAGRNRVVA